MNNTIFRRKFVLGVLIALVLGFGVQTVSDAVVVVSSPRGDLQDKHFADNVAFEFSFSISGVPESRPDIQGSVDDERESITITPTGSSIVEVRMNSNHYSSLSIAAGSAFTLKEWHTDNSNGSKSGNDDALTTGTQGELTNGTVTVKVVPTAIGSITVTVAAAGNSANDFENLTFTAHAVQPVAAVQALTFKDSTNVINPKILIVIDLDQVFTVDLGNAGSWVYVDFTVEGPGYLYKDLDGDNQPDSQIRSYNTFTDGTGVASIRLRMQGGTNKVKALIRGTPTTHVTTYIYQSVQLSKVSGDAQVGTPSALLGNPLVVQVRDSRGASISEQEVIFSASTGVSLATVPGYPADIHGVLRTVLTDSNGQAKINAVLPTDDTVSTVTAGIDTDHNQAIDADYRVIFTMTSDKNAAVIDPLEQLTVSAPASGTTGQPMTVTATTSDRRGEQRVTFSSNGGTFSPNPTSTSNNGGIATTQFTPTTTGAVTITAAANGYTDGRDTVQVSSGTPENPLNVLTQRPIRGTPGQTVNVQVSIGVQRSGVQVSITGDAITTSTASTNSSGVATIPVVLPRTAATYLLYANASGYAEERISVIVSGSAMTPTGNPPVRLEIPSGQTQTVSIGSSATLQVRVINTRTNAAQSGVEVTFRNSSGTNLSTVRTNNNGGATYQLAVRSDARQVISAVITDTNVDTSSATRVEFYITGRVQQPTTSTRLTIIQPVNSLGQPMNTGGPGASYPLTILLSNQNNTPAVNQVVTLTIRNVARVVQSTTVLITDNTGRAVTPDTFRLPIAAGQYTITAVSGTQTRSVTMTVVAIRLVKDDSDSVSGDNQEGDRGEVLDDPFVLKVVQNITAQTPVQGVPVTFTVTDGDGELSTSSNATSGSSTLSVRSGVNGDVRVYLVLGEDDEDNRVRASVGITGVSDVFFDATGAVVPYDLEIVSGNNQQIAPNQRSALMVVRVTDENGNDLREATVTFSMRGGRGTLTPRSIETDRNGEAEAQLVPRDTGTYFVEARVVGVTPVRFTITVGNLADDIEIVSGNNQRGDPGTELANPFVVEVLDDDDDTVSGVTVTFSVTGGGGSLSATSVVTNSRGRAQTTLTLGSEPGDNSVRASVSGVSTVVTFTARSTPAEPDVRLPASQRADMYWINTESGTLHRLVGDRVENIATGVRNAVSLVATKDQLYWVENTGNNSGRIRRSNLNGSNVRLIRDLSAKPLGIAVDTANSKIYLTNAWGKVQSINVDGSEYKPNLIRDLNDPKDIAVGSGKIYWITGDGTVQYANVDGSNVTQLSRGYDTLDSIAVGGGKVFWTEEISESDGNIHSANLNGSGVQEVVSLLAAPYGISVDTSANKLYFTNRRGRIMQGNLDGSGIQIVASNLVALGDVSVPSGTTRAPGTFSQYDVNRDGTVDNTDASLVAAALGESPPSNPRLDVNGDGMVNFLDLLLVFDNRDNANAAPVAISKLPNVSRQEIQNQIEQLLASDNHSATAQFTLAYLQNLLEVVTPEKTRLLANYPNPFNPETWIPYQLATSSNVQITIYNSAGREVRTLSLGHQSKGYYTDRNSAAYWDGRNAIGEQVSSGVYFYTLTADQVSATRKMLILK